MMTIPFNRMTNAEIAKKVLRLTISEQVGKVNPKNDDFFRFINTLSDKRIVEVQRILLTKTKATNSLLEKALKLLT